MARDLGPRESSSEDHDMSIEIGVELVLVNLSGVDMEYATGSHLYRFEIDVMEPAPTSADDQLMEVVAMADAEDPGIGSFANLGAPDDLHRQQRVRARLEPDVGRWSQGPRQLLSRHDRTLPPCCLDTAGGCRMRHAATFLSPDTSCG